MQPLHGFSFRRRRLSSTTRAPCRKVIDEQELVDRAVCAGRKRAWEGWMRRRILDMPVAGRQSAFFVALLCATSAHAQIPNVGPPSAYYGQAVVPPGYRSRALPDPTCAITRTCYPSPPPPMAYAPLPPAVVEAPPPPPMGWVYADYTSCADPSCGTLG
jgi:hypothetical protein